MPIWRVRLRKGLTISITKADAQRLKRSGFCWHIKYVGKFGYVVGDKTVRGRRTRVYLHRWIMRAPERSRVFWKNGKHLDCRRSNLVVVPFVEEAPYENLPVLPAADAGDAARRPPHAQEGAVL